jgi:hypothetical protein
METNSAGHQERQQTTKKPENRQACPVLSLRGKQLDHQRDRRKPQYTIVAIVTVMPSYNIGCSEPSWNNMAMRPIK